MKTRFPHSMTPFAAMAGAAALAALSLPSLAGIKYWDNPAYRAFDVGDYVQDGLVVNYDGIRNAGPDAPHDPSATNWVNCANPGTYDMTRYSFADSAWVAGASKGYWTDYGFVFNKDAVFNESAAFTIPTAFSHQILLDAKTSDQGGIGYPVCGAADGTTTSASPQNWQYGASIGLRSSGTITDTMYFTPMGSSNNGTRPAISGGTYTYGTAILNGNDAVLFDGITAPWSATSTGGTTGHYKNTSYTPTERTCEVGICLGGHYRRTDEAFKGTVKSYRFYSKVLSDEEVAWNRVVDEARYFHRKASIPVTNVVVVTTIPGIEDDHFAIDAEGFTFTAPAQKTVDGKRYVLGGYTVETWNGSAWGAPVSHNGENTCTLADMSAKVRLTWQYAAASGEGKLKTYDVSDYVWDGLMLFYDGIYNQGTNAVHSYSATTWVNIGIGDGTDRTLTRQHKVTTGDPGSWDADGYVFKGYSDFNKKSVSLLQPATHSIQILIDANVADQIYPSMAYAYATAWDYSSLALRAANDNSPKGYSFYWVTQKDQSKGRPYMLHPDKQYGYATAIQNGTDNTLRFFEGTDIPSSGGIADGFVELAGAATDFTASNFFLGGYNSNTSLLAGKIKFFRFYPNKALTVADVTQNRKVDEYRYFGRYIVTNVLVQSTYSYLEGYDKCGLYEVDGSYTFAAPETVTAPNGIEYACDGYIVETQDGSGWGNATHYTGTSYLYETSAGTVRLTWKWKATHGLRTAADYSFDDLAAGSVLHFDGLLNAGVGAARSTTATKWVNLGTLGAAGDASRTAAGSAGVGAWTDDGYGFVGGSKFSTAQQLVWTKSLTIQVLFDAAYTDNTATGDGNYVFSTGWNKAAMVLRGGDTPKTMWFHTQSLQHNEMPRIANADSSKFTFGTVITDDSSKSAVVFTGTEAPTSGTIQTGYLSRSLMADAFTSNVALGGWGGGAGQYLIGTIKNFRYYDRVLTEEELVRNRQVDSVRYFGALGVTNLVVEIEEGMNFNATPAPGAYFVEGSYEFTAAQGTDTPTRYKLQDWDEARGEWVNTRTINGTSFTYEAANAAAAKMKVTWCKTKAFMLIVR